MTPEQLRASILQQAMEGKLVKQDPNDEPADYLLKKIDAEREKLIKNKQIKKVKVLQVNGEEEKLFNIPESWGLVRLSMVANITKLAGFEYTKYIKPNLSTIGIPLFKAKNIRKGKIINKFENYIPETLSDNLLRSQLNKKCLLTPYVGSIGNVAIFNGKYKAHLGSNVGKIELIKIKNKGVLEEYLKYYLQSQLGYQELTKHLKSTAQPSISIAALRDVILPVPPLEEQKRIVLKIEKLMPLIDEYEKVYDRLKSIDNGFNDKMKQSILQYAMEGKLVKQDSNDEPASELLKKIKNEKIQLIKEKKIKRSKSLPKIAENEKLFDIPENWEWVRLKDITNFGNFNSVAGQDIQEGSWVLNMEDIIKNGGGFNKFTIKNLNDDFKSNKYIVEVGDVLYGKLRPYLRKIEIAPKNGFTTTEMFPIKVINQNLISPYYLRYVMLSPYFANRINGSTYGMKMPRVGTKYLASMLIPLPPFEEQKRIVTKVEKMMALVK
ncbi:restriction endonuclease subunit S [Limosilactobacillus reuteri]|uniref:Type I restriction modification DNA specificity domain-containing protein n=2 Tax=Limosilactobacillus reuteri TaxID=1598 RepID=S5NRG5_LIMRT|nr:restriction endonuclease subunit S [Limosilactobacillus reuteri]AGR64970.1 hypothetical protein N134_00825 [Limosilactobacillus reuteri TD1]MRG74655.1 restriction endonuclease subunit S [Limosilactobacillus reuteri]OUL55516.1 hypothetical protein B2G46_01020 [Limosilactobacillus reuteri]